MKYSTNKRMHLRRFECRLVSPGQFASALCLLDRKCGLLNPRIGFVYRLLAQTKSLVRDEGAEPGS